jgi:hypothetical protein
VVLTGGGASPEFSQRSGAPCTTITSSASLVLKIWVGRRSCEIVILADGKYGICCVLFGGVSFQVCFGSY